MLRSINAVIRFFSIEKELLRQVSSTTGRICFVEASSKIFISESMKISYDVAEILALKLGLCRPVKWAMRDVRTANPRDVHEDKPQVKRLSVTSYLKMREFSNDVPFGFSLKNKFHFCYSIQSYVRYESTNSLTYMILFACGLLILRYSGIKSSINH